MVLDWSVVVLNWSVVVLNSNKWHDNGFDKVLNRLAIYVTFCINFHVIESGVIW